MLLYKTTTTKHKHQTTCFVLLFLIFMMYEELIECYFIQYKVGEHSLESISNVLLHDSRMNILFIRHLAALWEIATFNEDSKEIIIQEIEIKVALGFAVFFLITCRPLLVAGLLLKLLWNAPLPMNFALPPQVKYTVVFFLLVLIISTRSCWTEWFGVFKPSPIAAVPPGGLPGLRNTMFVQPCLSHYMGFEQTRSLFAQMHSFSSFGTGFWVPR